MNNNHKIIILLVIIIVILAAMLGIMYSQNFAKKDCKINIKCEESMSNGDNITVRLIDLNKTPIANEKIVITLKKDNTTEKYNFTTDKKGLCILTLTDLDGGNYTINVSFDGNSKYKSANAHKTFTYSDEVSTTSGGNSGSSSNPINDNRPTNDPNYKGYTPYHESEVTSDGWNPQDHEVSRKTLADGNQEIRYDDGYYRLVDENGYVITYGYK